MQNTFAKSMEELLRKSTLNQLRELQVFLNWEYEQFSGSWLPVAHCELNPIELVWSQLKGQIIKRNRIPKLKEVEKLTKQIVSEMEGESGKKLWKDCTRHVKDLEELLMNKESIVDDFFDRDINRLVIEVREGDTTDEDEGGSSDEDSGQSSNADEIRSSSDEEGCDSSDGEAVDSLDDEAGESLIDLDLDVSDPEMVIQDNFDIPSD
jgi:hypothetical protein